MQNFLMFSPTFFNISPIFWQILKNHHFHRFSNFSTFTTILNNFFTIFPNFEKYWELFIDFNAKVQFMLLTASSSSSSSQPDSDLKKSVEDVEAEPDLEFQFAFFQDDHWSIWFGFFLADNLNFDLLFKWTYIYLQSSVVTKMF